MPDFVPFLPDELFLQIVSDMIDKNREKVEAARENLYKPVVDPFSAVFNAAGQGISIEQWLESRIVPRAEKSFQNAVGYFHEKIIQSIDGWDEAPQVVDAINREHRMLAEIKNRFNTTKGNHKVAIYDDLAGQIDDHFNGYLKSSLVI